MPDPGARSGTKTSRTRLKVVTLGILSGLVAAIAGVSIWLYRSTAPSGIPPIDPAQIAMGRSVYQQNCASCHGPNLEGQPDWKNLNPNGRLPAPPHDATGHTWHHTDGILTQIIEDGTAAYIGDGYESDMPGFGGLLSDNEIRAVLEFIKSTWPERERAYQEGLNLQEREREAGK